MAQRQHSRRLVAPSPPAHRVLLVGRGGGPVELQRRRPRRKVSGGSGGGGTETGGNSGSGESNVGGCCGGRRLRRRQQQLQQPRQAANREVERHDFMHRTPPPHLPNTFLYPRAPSSTRKSAGRGVEDRGGGVENDTLTCGSQIWYTHRILPFSSRCLVLGFGP